MALTPAQKSQVYEIFGIPESGTGYIASQLTSLYGPAGESYDFNAVVTMLNLRLDALSTLEAAAVLAGSTGGETRLTALLSRWTTLTSYDPLQVNEASGAKGTLVDYPKERKNIRKAMCNIIGFSCPAGGFETEQRSAYGVTR